MGCGSFHKMWVLTVPYGKEADRSKAGSAMAGRQSGSVSSSATSTTKRKLIVFVALCGSLTATALLLQLLSPVPEQPQAYRTLSSVNSMEAVTRTIMSGPQTRNWKYIFIHHSKTPDGDAQSIGETELGDHFVICNGDGGIDGDVQTGRRWANQLPALAPRGASSIRNDCISICLVGDFDHARPTPAQIRRLGQLVSNLQSNHKIAGSNVLVANHPSAPAGIGKYFPMNDFRQQILTLP